MGVLVAMLADLRRGLDAPVKVVADPGGKMAASIGGCPYGRAVRGSCRCGIGGRSWKLFWHSESVSWECL